MFLLRGAALALALALAALPCPVRAAPATGAPSVAFAPPPAAASGASGSIDPVAATRAYLDELPPEAKARSDAYFEGGYWLMLWDFLWGAGVFLLLLFTGASARMRDRAERLARSPALRSALYAAQFLVVTSLLSLPLAFYEGHLREHRYGLSNLTLGGFLGEWAKGSLVSVVLGTLGLVALYAVIRRVERTWWIWGGALAVVLALTLTLITPVAIVPLFNSPHRLRDERVVRPILAMARAHGVAASDVWEVDASRQSTRISANVSGLLGTERITLNDNLLSRASLPEIEAVMGHELGHHVLHHAYRLSLELGLVWLAGFALVNTLFERLRRARFAARWRVRGIADVAGLPLAALLFTAFALLATPVTSSIVRVSEAEADLFGLDAARQPDGFARVALKLSDYRKLEPGPLEELVFFDHPSGRTRILTAMRWKAEHPETWSAGTAAAHGGPSP